MDNEISFINNSWRYVKRVVNLNNFTIQYIQNDGFTTKTDDEKFKRDLQKIKKIANIQYTFCEYVDYWLTDIFIPNTDTVTKTIGVWAVRHLLLPSVKQDVLLNYITPDYINDIIERCIPVCASSGETVLKFMRRILKTAYAYGFIPKDIREHLIKVKRAALKLELLTKEELKLLLQEASTHPGYYFEILLGLFVGLRTGEIRGLKYDDFDRAAHTIRISRQYTSNYFLSEGDDSYEYSYYVEEKSPKADSCRILRVPDFLFEELEKKKSFNEKIICNLKEKGIKGIEEEYISISPFGQRKRKNTLLTALKRTCNRAGVPAISFHTLRHQYATMLIEKGIPFEDVSKLLGHKSVLTTFNIYCGVMDVDDDARVVISTMIPCVEGGMNMAINRPEINPTFFYGPIISYKFIGGITKDKGKFRIQFVLYFQSGDTVKSQKSGFSSVAEAAKAKDVLIADLVRNEYIPFQYTVKEYFDYWLYYYMLEKQKIKYNTFQTYRNILYNYLLPALGAKTRLQSVSIDHLTKVIREIPYPSVKRQCAKLSKSTFGTARSQNMIAFDPSIAAVENVKKELERSQKREVQVFSVEQIRKLLSACKENFKDMYIPLLISITMGTRISETIGIQYSDIDFSSKNIYIKRQLGKDMKGNEGKGLTTRPIETKTANGVRCVPVPEWVADELMVKRAWYEMQKRLVPGFRDTGYVCCHCNGTPFQRSAFGEDFHQLLSMCGLPDIHWHDLRHIYASVLKNNAVNLKAISVFLGHHSPDFTEDVYVHETEVVYDCTILEEVWTEIHPKDTKLQGISVSVLPFEDDDYNFFFQ